MPVLSREEWAAVKPPFCWVKITHKDFGQVHIEIALKWITERCGGWLYFDGDRTFVFQDEGDRMIFTIWLRDSPYDDLYGDLI